MGKVNKRQPTKHSNHHDNPMRNKKVVTRRQHSQSIPKAAKSGVKSTRSSKSNGNIDSSNQSGKARIPFSNWDQILLVGEGDFSFASSLSLHHDVESIVATCFDSKEVLQQKYPNVMRTIGKLDSKFQDEELWEGLSPLPSNSDEESTQEKEMHSGLPTQHSVMYGIDATKLSTTHKKVLKPHSPFTKIVFNFPHVGGLSTDVNRQVRSNQQLLVNFFNAAKPLLATAKNPAKSLISYGGEPGEDITDDVDNSIQQQQEQQDNHLQHGQILVTLFEGAPYSLWNIRDLARHTGLKVLESFNFPWKAYPGYKHARTIGDITSGKDRSEEGKRRGAWRGEEREARCYILALKEDDDGRPAPGSRKRKKAEDDAD